MRGRQWHKGAGCGGTHPRFQHQGSQGQLEYTASRGRPEVHSEMLSQKKEKEEEKEERGGQGKRKKKKHGQSC